MLQPRLQEKPWKDMVCFFEHRPSCRSLTSGPSVTGPRAPWGRGSWPGGVETAGAPGGGRASEAETRLSWGFAATGREQALRPHCGAQTGVSLATSVILREKRGVGGMCPPGQRDGHRPERWALGGPVGSGREKSRLLSRPGSPGNPTGPSLRKYNGSDCARRGAQGRAALEKGTRGETALWFVQARP